MKHTAHTPGPWLYALNGLNRNKAHEPQFTFGPSFECLGVVYNRTSAGTEGSTEEANARLIAAAPDLLAALELAHRSLVTCNSCHCIGSLPTQAERAEAESATLLARAAIARATNGHA